MQSDIVAVVHVIWGALPALTVALKFGTAVIGFVAAARLLVRRSRRARSEHR